MGTRQTPPHIGRVRRERADKKGKALDLYCGAGTNTVYLVEKGFGVTAIDISQRAIEYAKEKAGYTNVKINLMTQSFVGLSFEDEDFDFVFDMGCFHHVEIEDRPKFIKGIYRVLKKGGDYLLTCFSYKKGARVEPLHGKTADQTFLRLLRHQRNQKCFFYRR
jgi:ubiquinone/menaquinone biosynthesis C-methylase UbiE